MKMVMGMQPQPNDVNRAKGRAVSHTNRKREECLRGTTWKEQETTEEGGVQDGLSLGAQPSSLSDRP